jgi:hypothetical protein
MKPENGSFWARHSLPLAVAVVLLVSALGSGLDVLLVKEGLPRLAMVMFSNTLTGVIAGWLFYSFAQHERHRRELIRERMHTIAELNHHIRNALQVIRYWGGTQSHVDAVQLQLINESVDRIEWALREVLPKYPASSTAAAPESPHPDFTSNRINDFISERKQTGPH